MADVLSMSLDDIINKNKDKVGGRGKDRSGEDGKRSREDRNSSRRPAKAGSRGGSGKLALGGLRVVVKNSGVSKAGGARNARGQVHLLVLCPFPDLLSLRWVPMKALSGQRYFLLFEGSVGILDRSHLMS